MKLTVLDGLDPRHEVHRLLLRAAALQRLEDADAARDNARAAAALMDEYGLSMTGALMPQEGLQELAGYVHADHPDIPHPVGVLPARIETAYLTPRELVVLNNFAVHGSANQVADALNVSVNTVKSQRRSILKMLRASSLEEALSIARRQRLLED
jgi:LuxR family maltose regulon positive regulatory protein